ncbi:MAG: hypothetical protein RML94_09255 [Bacteroidia bacterium]|nr:hypothetical protein [Bacteroidia bacterium]
MAKKKVTSKKAKIKRSERAATKRSSSRRASRKNSLVDDVISSLIPVGVNALSKMFVKNIFVRSGVLFGAGYVMPERRKDFVLLAMTAATEGILDTSIVGNVKKMLGLSDDISQTSAPQQVEYVNLDELQDSGYVDDNGNQCLMDREGRLYALADDGVYDEIGDVYSLSDDMRSVSMLPLQDDLI